MAAPSRAKALTETAMPSRPGRPPEVVSGLRGTIPVTEAEIQLVLAMVGPEIAEIFSDEPDP